MVKNRQKKWWGLTLLCLPFLLCGACKSSREADMEAATVKHFDLSRFMGRWYEIARYDHRFERGMTHVTADYILLPDGTVRVVNQGIKKGKKKEITGKARQPDPDTFPGHLEVSFFLWYYYDYNVLYVDSAYQHAIVGSSSDKYLWILSRTPSVSDKELDKLLEIAKQRGYGLTRLIDVEQ